MQLSCRLAVILCSIYVILLVYHAEGKDPSRNPDKTKTQITTTTVAVKRDGADKTTTRKPTTTTTQASRVGGKGTTTTQSSIKRGTTTTRPPTTTTTQATRVGGKGTTTTQSSIKRGTTTTRPPTTTTTQASRKSTTTTQSVKKSSTEQKRTPVTRPPTSTTTKPVKSTPKDDVPNETSKELQSTACPYKCRKSCRSLVADAKGACKLFSSGKTLSDTFKKLLTKEGLENLFKKVVDHAAFVIASDVISCQKMLALLKLLKPKEKTIDLELVQLTSPNPKTDLTKHQMATIVTVLNKTVVEAIVNSMSKDLKKKACLVKSPCMLQKIVWSTIKCDEVLKGAKLKPSDEKMLACDGVNRIKSSKGQAQLTDDDCSKILTDYPVCLRNINIDACKPAAFVAAATKLIEICLEDKITKSVKITVMKKVLLASDKTSKVAKTVLACGGDVEQLRKGGFTSVQLLESLSVDVIKKLPKPEQSTLLRSSKKLSSAQKSKVLKTIGTLICTTGNMKYLGDLTKTELESIICDLASSTKCPGLSSQIQKQLTKYKNFATFDKTKAKCFSCLLLGDVSSRQLKKIPKLALTQVLDEDVFKSCPADVKLVCKNVKILIDKISDARTGVSLASYKKFGDRLKQCLDFSEVAKFPSAILCDETFVEDLNRIEGKPTSQQCRKIKAVVSDTCLKRFKCKFGRSGRKEEATELATYLKEEKDVPARKYESPITVLIELESKLSEKVKDWVLTYFRSLMTTNILPAIGCNVIEVLLDVNLKDKLEVLIQATPKLNERMLICLTTKWIKQLQGGELTGEEDDEVVGKVSGFIKENEASKFKIPCKKKCELNGLDISGLSRMLIKKLANECIKCLQPSQKLTEGNLALLGNLVCGLDDLSRIDLSITNVVKILSSCPYMGEEIRRKQCQAKLDFLKKDISSMTVEDIEIMGHCILSYLPPENKDVFCEVIVGISEGINEDFKRRRERTEKGFKDCSEKDKQENEKRTNSFMDTSLKMFIEFKCIEPVQRRRKRSAGALTCDVINIFGEAGVKSMTKENIASLSSDDFLSCVDNFCFDSLNVEQLKALADKAKEKAVWGVPSGWTEDQIDSACYFVKGLTSAELSSLNLTENIMDSLSKIKTWEENQRAAIYQGFMDNIVQSNDSSVLEPGHLMTLGAAVCGADTDAIKAMNTSAIMNSLPALGVNVPACNTMQKIAFLENVKTLLGNDVSKYKESNIELLGGIMAGVTSSTVKTLTVPQIQAMSGYVIAALADEVFMSMTSEQLSALSSIQAQSVTDSQLANLPADKRRIVLELAGSDVEISHAAVISWNPTTCLVLVACVLLTYM